MSQRTYGGRSAEDRRAERRERLVAAGFERFGTDGFAATGVRALCAEAKVSERYFYESFRSREELLVAVLEDTAARVAEQIVAAIAAAPRDPAARARAGTAAVVEALTSDARVGRILLRETVGVDPVVERARRDVTRAGAGVVAAGARELLGPGAGPSDGELAEIAVALVGAVLALVDAWQDGALDITPEGIVERSVALFDAVARNL